MTKRKRRDSGYSDYSRRVRPRPSNWVETENPVPRSFIASYNKGNDAHDEGSRAVIKTTMPRKQSMKEKFQAREDAANGYVTVVRFVTLRQTSIDQWGFTKTDINGNWVEHFTPRKFKDAEAVSFNGKALTTGGYSTTTTAANGTTLRDIYIQYSHVRYNFYNVQQHTCKLEMYICYAKNGEASTAPENDLALCYDMYMGNSNTITVNTPYHDIMANKEWLSLWDVTKVEFKLEPGEQQTYFLKGPQDYVLDAKRHCATGTTDTTTPVTWDSYNKQGNGCAVFFRMLNNITLVANTDVGTAADSNLGGRKIGAHHPPNNVPAADGSLQGGIAIRYLEYYHIKAPENVDDVDQRNFLNAFHTIAGGNYVDVQVDTDQAMTVPTTVL